MNGGACYCGHPFGSHKMLAVLTFPLGDQEVPAGGFMECPECDCRATWSVPDEVAGYDVIAALKAYGIEVP